MSSNIVDIRAFLQKSNEEVVTSVNSEYVMTSINSLWNEDEDSVFVQENTVGDYKVNLFINRSSKELSFEFNNLKDNTVETKTLPLLSFELMVKTCSSLSI